MTEPKFTPGPWKYSNYTFFLEITDDDPCNIREVCYIDDWEDEQETMANAALIAAAPELYDMVQMLADECYQLGGEAVSPLVDEARRLLAKAIGEAK